MGVVTVVVGVTVVAGVITVPPVGAVETGVVTSGSVVAVVVTTTGASAGGVAAKVVAAVVACGTVGPVSVRVWLSSLTIASYTRSLNSSASCISVSTLSSSVRSNISESNRVRVLSFSPKFNLSCGLIWFFFGKQSVNSVHCSRCRSSVAASYLSFPCQGSSAAAASASVDIIYFRFRSTCLIFRSDGYLLPVSCY